MADENNVMPEAGGPAERAVETAIADNIEQAPVGQAAPASEAATPTKPRTRKPRAKKAETPAEAPAAAPAKRRGRPRKNPEAAAPAKKTPAKKTAPVEKKETVIRAEEYTVEEAAEIMSRTVARKRSEAAAIGRSLGRVKKASSIAEKQALLDYINADINAYVSVIADMTDDDSLLDGIDTDAEPVSVPENYQKAYLDRLSIDDLENEQEAEEIRAEYCDAVIEDMCASIGETALSSKKMIRALLDDPYALEVLGEVIFYDDSLYECLRAIVEEGDEKLKKKDKKSKKKSKKKKA